jgi:hypothetical protein
MGKMGGAGSRILSAALGAALLGVNSRIIGDTAMASGATTAVTVFAGQPDVPRNLTVTGNAAAVAGNVVIVGTNAGGETITETIVASGTSTVVGNKAFKTITSITLPAWVSANTERIRVGTGAKLGLGALLSRNSVLRAFLGGVLEGTAPTVAFSATALESNTVTLNSALNGSAVLVDFYETL